MESEQSARRPRLAYLTSLYARATDTFIRSEVTALRERGYEIHTFSIRRPERDQIVNEQIASERGRTCDVLSQGVVTLLGTLLAEAIQHPCRMIEAAGLAWHSGNPGFTARFKQACYLVEAAYLARALRHKRIEHLHNHIPHNSASVAMLAARLTRIPFSMTVHGPTEFYHPRHWSLATKLREATFTVCISHFCRSQCRLFCDSNKAHRLKLVRCGVADDFLRQPAAPMPSAPRLVFVGRLCDEKAPDVLIDAAAWLRDQGVPFELSIIGDGPQRVALQRQVARLKLNRHVTLLGQKNSERVREHLRASRALVLPSLAEGLPVVLMEALALQRPVISTWIAAIPELVEPERSGWLVPPGDVVSLAEAMHRAVTSSSEELEAMGERGARTVRRLHDVKAQASQLDALFRGDTPPTGDTHEDKSAHLDSPTWLAYSRGPVIQ